jgi:penicillin-binding protein 1B
MSPGTEVPDPPAENPDESVAAEQPWQRKLKRTVAVASAILLVPLVIFLAVAGWYYFHYSRIIDAQLQDGPFRDSINIYGAPSTLNDGDALSAKEIEAELRLSGYEPGGNGKTGSFKESPGGLEITPPAGSDGSPVHIVMGANGEIQRIEANGRDMKTWTVGYPLLENLSAGNERRKMVTFQDLPPVLVNAVVSIEDKHFFHHQGLDLPRIIKAAYVDVREHRKEQGASTLTMQLVRGLWLQPEKKWKRKMAEAIMTVHLERKWSKEEIFTAYANQVFLGREAAYSVHGFAEGAQLFFGKEPRNLTLTEAALLAGMVQRPSYFNPYRNPERATKRRDVVLELMRGNKYISRDQYEQAVAAPLNLVGPAGAHEELGAPYFLDLVNDELQSIDQTADGSKNVYTTIDLNLQRAARDAIESGMKEVDKLLAKQYSKGGQHAEAALIALDPHTGEVKAMVGGRDYARSQLNRIYAKRPPGSVFKPFVYATAMNTGIAGGGHVLTPASIVDDSPTTFVFDQKTYTPGNFRNEVFGTLTLRQALAKSDNVAAVKVAEMVGYPAVVAMARSAGLNGEIKATPAVALGSYAVTPFEMAGAYTAFANGGLRMEPQMVSFVRNAEGETIHREQSEARQAVDPRVAFLITSMLQEVMRSGTAAGVRSRGFTLPAAGKTGTSHDGWFAGYTSQLLCIVWVGFDDYRELNLEGAKSALPIWTEFMKKAGHLGAYRNAHEFVRPSGVASAKICSESGKLAGDFCTKTLNEVFIAGTQPQDKCEIHSGLKTIPDNWLPNPAANLSSAP